MSPVEPARYHEPGRDDDDIEGGEVIAFPGAGPSGAGASVEVTETEPDPDGEVLVGEIVDEDRDGAGELERYEPAVAPAQIMRSYWRRTRPALRPDRLTWAIAKHELYYGTRGLAHGVPPLWRWVTAAELDQQLATNPQLVLETRKRRRIILLSALGGAGAGAAAAWVLVAPAAVVAAVLAVLTVAGAVERTRAGAALDGAEQGRPALGTDPSSKEIKGVLVDAKLAKSADQVRVVGPVVRTEADNAWEAVAELPSGTTFKHAAKKRGEIAAAIGVDEVQVALDPVRGHNGRVRLWCADEDPMQGGPIPSPLVTRNGRVDFWADEVFAGRDPRDRAVEFSLVERSYLVGGEPGGGKSVACNNILAFAALDPSVRLWLADGKGGFDLADFEPIAHKVLPAPEHEDMMAMIGELQEEMERRYAKLRKAGFRKVTKEVANKLDMPPILLHVDEIQKFALGDGDTKKGKAFITAIADVVGRGRAAGIVTGAVTQRPAADVVPTRLRDILSIRWALRCTTAEASDTILGSGRASQGYSAALFTAEQRGAGYLLAEGATPVQERTAFISDEEVAGIARRAWDLRKAAGTLPAGADRPEVRLLAAVLEAMGGEHKGAHTADLLPALAKVSGEYQEWDGARLAAALRPLGVAPVQLDIGGRNRNGYRRADVAAALERV